MYYVMRASAPSLLRESTDSLIQVFAWNKINIAFQSTHNDIKQYYSEYAKLTNHSHHRFHHHSLY